MKKYLIHILDCFAIILIFALLSLMYGHWVEYLNIFSCGLLLTCVIGWSVMFIRGKYKHLLIFVFALLCVTNVHAQTNSAAKAHLGLTQAVDCQGLSGEEKDNCVYTRLCADYQTQICAWAKKLDVEKNYSQSDREEMQIVFGYANQVTTHQTKLGAAYRTNVNCSQNSTDCYCCAFNYQFKYNSWLAKHGGTGESNIRTVPVILASAKTQCWPCDIVLIFFVIIENMIINSAYRLAVFALSLTIIIMLFWIVFRVWKLVLDLSTASTFFPDLLRRILIVSCGALILNSVIAKGGFKGSMYQGLFLQIIQPFMELSIGLAQNLSNVTQSYNNNFFGVIQQQLSTALPRGSIISYCGSTTEAIDAMNARIDFFFGSSNGYKFYFVPNDQVAASGKMFSAELVQNFLCVTERVYNQLAPLTATASVIVSSQVANFRDMFNLKRYFDAIGDYITGGKALEKMPNFSISQLAYGLLLYIPCLLLSWILAFEILDICIRMLFVFSLSPVALACSLFPITRHYAKQTVKFFFSLLMDFVALVISAGFLLAMVDTLLPQDIIEKLVCWMFDTTGKLSRNSRGICILPSAGVASLGPDLWRHSNQDYAKHLYIALTGTHGARFILTIVGMYFLGTKLLSSMRSSIRSMLGADVGINIGGSSILGAAVMEAQETTRRSIGLGLTAVPLVNKVISSAAQGTGKITDSVTSAGTRAFNTVANTAARGVNAVGDVSATAINATGNFAGGGLRTFGHSINSTASGIASIPVLGWVLAPLMYAVGATAIGVGYLVQGATKVTATVVKAISRVTSTVVKTTKIAFKAVAQTGNKITKTAGRFVSSSVQQFFYLPGNTADIKREEKRQKDKKKKNRSYYYK